MNHSKFVSDTQGMMVRLLRILKKSDISKHTFYLRCHQETL